VTLRFPNLVIDQYHNSLNVPCTVIRSTSTISRNKLLTSGNTLHVSRTHFLLFPANDEAVSQPVSTCNIGKTRLFRGPSVDKCKYLSCLLQRIALYYHTGVWLSLPTTAVLLSPLDSRLPETCGSLPVVNSRSTVE